MAPVSQYFKVVSILCLYVFFYSKYCGEWSIFCVYYYNREKIRLLKVSKSLEFLKNCLHLFSLLIPHDIWLKQDVSDPQDCHMT